MSKHQTNVRDALTRPLKDLRISLTDRCNFRCKYCMPKEIFGKDYPFLSDEETLTIDEIVRVTTILSELGVHKVRLTGGEPILRRDLPDIVRAVSDIPGIDDIAVTTNGSMLTERRAIALKEAGLRRITVSLDALDDTIFKAMNDVGFPVARVLTAIDTALSAGLAPVKVNMVVRKGMNESQVLPMAERFRDSGVILRFIEYMDVGNSNGWQMNDVVPAADIYRMIDDKYSLIPVEPNTPGDVAERFAYADGAGEIGIIHSVTNPFCRGCSRLRLTASGELFTCLFGTHGTPIRHLLRNGTTDEALRALFAGLWRGRRDRYSEERSSETIQRPRVEMSRIGG
ncbi:GTP 3',8-cyclase MoaA [Alicyclobacillus fastidiosus]|uniref:GTP 3',8-cyclase n=1 Tax=Alicyclobacillus fastidiosus TaxID=392011 RepID=A0ABV5AFK6_9BACL|nr:GTP 3',8-cyclase MoaA [Alicyclobacillus fastidiosus]WEH09643.1 GTP 3',8-cyclase MoaA [Alicyclobacillus fastidiosus]